MSSFTHTHNPPTPPMNAKSVMGLVDGAREDESFDIPVVLRIHANSGNPAGIPASVRPRRLMKRLERSYGFKAVWLASTGPRIRVGKERALNSLKRSSVPGVGCNDHHNEPA